MGKVDGITAALFVRHQNVYIFQIVEIHEESILKEGFLQQQQQPLMDGELDY